MLINDPSITEIFQENDDDFMEQTGATGGTRKAKFRNLAAKYIGGKAPRGGIISTGASAVGTTQDNAGLAAGTSNRSGGVWLRLPDWTPAANVPIWTKFASNLGTKLWVTTTGLLRLEYGNGSNFSTYRFDSTVATGLADGSWAFIAWTEDRAGNVSFYVNGALLGTAVAISAASAQTVTNTGALLWGSDGSTHTVGTFGESFKISGLLTATNIADIYKEGSIAPFSASFTFFQWCDFGQGYGPIIKDRSGQNQPALMGTSGLTHAVPRNPPGVPQRAPRTALVGGGDNAKGAIARNVRTNQNPGTGEFAAYWDGILPAADTNFRALFGVSSSATTVVTARALVCFWTSSTGLQFVLYGATTSDTRSLIMAPSAAALFVGLRVVIEPRRSSAGMRIYIGLAGDFFDATALFTESTAGTPPAWTDQIDGQYTYIGGQTTTSANLGANVFDYRDTNVAMTEAQLRTEYERGEPGPEWARGSKTQLITGDDSTFASDTGFWTKGNAATISGGKANLTGGTNSNISKVLLVPLGQKARLTVTVDTIDAAAYVTDGNITITIAAATLGAGTTGTKVIEFTGGPTWGFQIVSPSGTLVLDNLSLELLGYTSRLRTDTAAGLTALDGSSNKNDFLFSTTGVTTSPNGRTQIIRTTTNTNGNQQLLGAACVDATRRWRVRSWNITSAGTPTISLGLSSGTAGYASAVVLVAGPNSIPLIYTPAGLGLAANFWCASNSNAQLDHTIILDLVD